MHFDNITRGRWGIPVLALGFLLTLSLFFRAGIFDPVATAQDDEGWEIEVSTHDHEHGEEAEGHTHGAGEVLEVGTVEVPPDMVGPLGIVSAPVERGDLIQTLDLYGWIRPRPGNLTELSAPIAGIVEEFLALPGDLVESGSPLVTLRVPDALEWQKIILTATNNQARAKNAKGLLASEGRAKVIQLLGELKVAATERTRLEEELAMLEQAGSNAVSKRDLNAKRGELRSAEALLEAKRSLALAYDLTPEFIAGVEGGSQSIQAPEGSMPPDLRRELAQAGYDLQNSANDDQVAAQNLAAFGFNHGLADRLRKGQTEALTDMLTLYAKQPGLVTELLTERQVALNPGDPIIRSIDYRQIHIDVEVPEVDITKVFSRVSDQVRVVVTGLGDRVIDGHVAYFDTSVHPDVRKAHLVVEVENLEGMPLRDHMAVTVGVPLAIKPDTLSVPKTSVLTDGFEKIVFLDEGEHFHRAAVKTGIETLGRFEVLEGISAEDKVVVSGARALYLGLIIPKGGGDAHAGHNH